MKHEDFEKAVVAWALRTTACRSEAQARSLFMGMDESERYQHPTVRSWWQIICMGLPIPSELQNLPPPAMQWPADRVPAGKPSWDSHGWAQIFQNEDGHWFGVREGWTMNVVDAWKGKTVWLLREDGGFLSRGEVNPDWENSLEQRPVDYKALYDEALGETNAAGYVGMTPAEVIRLQAEELQKLQHAAQMPGPIHADTVLLNALESQSKNSYSGLSVEYRAGLGYRVMTHHKIGDWDESLRAAIHAYLKKWETQ